ncbi:hypothetical protein [Streptomyces sp. 3N207]|uniref:hypothetical protein n=1 Tax=Streptomyces sp. 3N207 TaxID=3457417 RepID=UPI003FD583B1
MTPASFARTAAVLGAAALLATALGAQGRTAPAETAPTRAAQQELPVLGHFRNNHPADRGTWGDRMRAAEGQYGPFAGHWRNYRPAGEEPLDDKPTGDDERAALAAGKQLHLSWRPYPDGQNWAYTASGANAQQLRSVMRRLQATCEQHDTCSDIWLSIAHEPELDFRENCGEIRPCAGYQYADFRGMWNEVAKARKAVGADKVRLVWIVQGWRNDKDFHANLWPGNDKVDVVGQDPYIMQGTPAAELGERMVQRKGWFEDWSDEKHDYASKPHIFAEYGCDLEGRGDAQHRADCIKSVRRSLPQIADHDDPGEIRVVEMAFFDARTSRLEDAESSPDVKAYHALKDATEG